MRETHARYVRLGRAAYPAVLNRMILLSYTDSLKGEGDLRM